MKNARKFLFLVLIAIMAVTVAACGGDDDGGGDDGDAPEAVMQQVLESLFAGDVATVEGLVCESAREELGDAEDAALPEGMEMDLSGLEFTSEIDGDTATVNVSGEISMSMEVEGETISESASIDDLGGEFADAPFVREDGEWKFCPEDVAG